MTTTQAANRWWAPSAPGIGPDPVDLDMLAASGADPRMDLGASVLAAHRVGAAACEMAASMPLVDVGTLINCLADAREKFAEPMIDSVSKSVEGEGYACVLVRDVLDEAEEAAVDLFRAAVSRGVAPPVAASRVGAVFGVSKAGIGKYRQLASDPRANPLTIADAADRVLFSFVEQLTEAETEPIEVSKITPAERRRRAEAENRDRQGRFATTDQHSPLMPTVSDLLRTQGHTENAPQTEVGDAPVDMQQPGLLARMRARYGFGGGTAPSRVGETAEEVIARQRQEQATRADQAARARKAQAARRQQQASRPKPRAVPTGRTVADRTSAPRQSAPRTSAGRQSTGRRNVNIARAVREQLGVNDYETPTLHVDRRNMDWMRIADASYTPRGDRLIDTDIGVPLTEEQALGFNARVQGRPGALFRMGELTQLTGGNNVEEITGDLPHTQDPYEHAVDATARQIDAPEPTAVRIDPKHRELVDLVSEKDIQNKLFVMAADASSEHDGLATPYASAHDDGYYLVHQGPGAIPQVYEYVIEEAVGHVSESARHPQWTLDPNQLYRLSSAQEGWETVYDPRGFLRTRIPVTPVSESEAQRYIHERGNIDKADRPWVRTEPRNAQGEWVRQRLAQVPVEQAPADPRAAAAHRANQARHAREQRAKQRQQPAAPSRSEQPVRVSAPRTSAARQSAARTSRKLSPLGQRRVQRVKNQVQQAFATRERMNAINEFNFDPSSDYAILANGDWAELIGYTNSPYLDSEYVKVSGADARTHVLEHVFPGVTGQEAVAEAYERDEIHDAEPMEMAHVMTVEPGDSDEDAGGHARLVNDLLERPGVAAVKIAPAEGHDAAVMHITANRNRPTPIYVVAMDPTLYGEDYDLEIGDHPMATVSSETLWPDGGVTSYAVPVVFYRQVPRSSGRNPEGER